MSHQHTSSAPYALRDLRRIDEDDRLARLSDVTNAATFQRLSTFGPMDGWHCIDIGSGDGSVAAWLAERVGAAGRVVASDLEPDRLRPFPGVERVRLDLTTDELDAHSFDLVHARSVLLHVAEPRAALRKMVDALKPGGVLMVEDSDLTTFAASDPDHPLAAEFERSMRLFPEALAAAGVHPTLGPRLPALVGDPALGLVDVDCAARLLVFRGGTEGAELWKRNVANVFEHIGVKAERASAARAKAALDDPTFWFASTLRFQVWGWKPL